MSGLYAGFGYEIERDTISQLVQLYSAPLGALTGSVSGT